MQRASKACARKTARESRKMSDDDPMWNICASFRDHWDMKTLHRLQWLQVAVHGLNAVELEMNEVATERHIQDWSMAKLWWNKFAERYLSQLSAVGLEQWPEIAMGRQHFWCCYPGSQRSLAKLFRALSRTSKHFVHVVDVGSLSLQSLSLSGLMPEVQYLKKPREVFSELQRVLKPGGMAVVAFSHRSFIEKAGKRYWKHFLGKPG